MIKSTTLLAIPVVLICLAATPAQPEPSPVAPSKIEQVSTAEPAPRCNRRATPSLTASSATPGLVHHLP